jgi:hypothetical protein
VLLKTENRMVKKDADNKNQYTWRVVVSILARVTASFRIAMETI